MKPEPITSSLLNGLTHGFFTRQGGVSSGIFESLNCGFGSTDDTENVAENRARVAAWLAVEPQDLLTVHQVHSSDVLVIGPDDAPGGAPVRADAIVTNRPGKALAVLTADCQPVLFADSEAAVVGAAHAGWRGALAGILEATVEAMVGLSAKRERIVAVIGPAISQRAYEVGQEFFEQFVDTDRANARFFANGPAGKYLFNLPAYGLHRLRGAGIAEAEWVGHCTCFEEARFFSYRRSLQRNERDYGRQISAIRL